MGAGIIIDTPDGVFTLLKKTIKEGGNSYMSEYIALKFTIDFINNNNLSTDDLTIVMDCQPIIRQMTGLYGCKSTSSTKDYYDYCIEHKKDIQFKWVPRDKNTEADKLSKQALEL